MTPHAAALMAQYNRWMNQRLYAAAARLPAAELLRDRGAFFGSLFGTLNHLAAADTIWLHRFAQHPGAHVLREALAPFPPPQSLRQAMGADLPALQTCRDALDGVIEAWAGTLTADALQAPLVYRNMAGEAKARRFGDLLLHFFNHQTHHRGQASTLLFQAGEDPGVTDLLAILPEAG